MTSFGGIPVMSDETGTRTGAHARTSTRGPRGAAEKFPVPRSRPGAERRAQGKALNDLRFFDTLLSVRACFFGNGICESL